MTYVIIPKEHVATVKTALLEHARYAGQNTVDSLSILNNAQEVEVVGYSNPDWIATKGNGTIVKKPAKHWTSPLYGSKT